MQGKIKLYLRYLEKELRRCLGRGYSCLILGPRQVGKTTLVSKVVQKFKHRLEYLLQNPSVRIELEANPSRIIRQVQAMKNSPLVFVDEAQKIPDLFDAAQLLLDRKEAQFILTGSSARKLRRSGTNLLPGRIKRFYLTPLLWGELGFLQQSTLSSLSISNINPQTGFSFEDSLIFGSLPGIVQLPSMDRSDFLRSYVEIY